MTLERKESESHAYRMQLYPSDSLMTFGTGKMDMVPLHIARGYLAMSLGAEHGLPRCMMVLAFFALKWRVLAWTVECWHGMGISLSLDAVPAPHPSMTLSWSLGTRGLTREKQIESMLVPLHSSSSSRGRIIQYESHHDAMGV